MEKSNTIVIVWAIRTINKLIIKIHFIINKIFSNNTLLLFIIIYIYIYIYIYICIYIYIYIKLKYSYIQCKGKTV